MVTPPSHATPIRRPEYQRQCRTSVNSLKVIKPLISPLQDYQSLLVRHTPQQWSSEPVGAIFLSFRSSGGRSPQNLGSLLSLHIPVIALVTNKDDVAAITEVDNRGSILPWMLTASPLSSIKASVDYPARTLEHLGSWDLPEKRNLAIALAVQLGISKILLVDDDVCGITRDTLDGLAAALDQFAIAGITIGGFPDHSVFDHARDLRGGAPGPFLSGACLAVNTMRALPYFPPIYNEDWLAVSPHLRARRVAVMAGDVYHSPYDPFNDGDRATFQEFGEVVLYGVFDATLRGAHGDCFRTCHWRSILNWRRETIKDLQATLRHSDACRVLQHSLNVLQTITPTEVRQFLRAWRAHRHAWECALRNHQSAICKHRDLAGISRYIEDFCQPRPLV